MLIGAAEVMEAGDPAAAQVVVRAVAPTVVMDPAAAHMEAGEAEGIGLLSEISLGEFILGDGRSSGLTNQKDSVLFWVIEIESQLI